MDSDIGQQYLDQFDTLDLSSREHRRLGVYTLKEFYATVMAEIGRERLHFGGQFKRKPLDGLWGQLLDRIGSFTEIEVPDEYNRTIHQLKQFRADTHHNSDYDPPRRQLEECKKEALGWRQWLLEHSDEYQRLRDELDPQEAMVNAARMNLESVIDERELRHTEELNELRETAHTFLDTLAEHEEDDEITIDLVETLMNSIELKSRTDELIVLDAQYEDHLAWEAEDMLEMRRF